jgi:hypothetical protein
MSNPRLSSFLERHQHGAWQERAASIIHMIDEMSMSSSFSSLSSISSGSLSSDFDDDRSDNEMLVDEVYVSLGNQRAIANRLTQTIAHPNIVWRTKNGLTIEELSEDDALTFFRFRKEHLQIVADKLWPRLAPYLLGEKGCIKFGFGRYSCGYETLLLLMMYRLSRPCQIHCEMEASFEFRRSKICAGIGAMMNAMYTLAVQYLDDPIIFLHRMPRYADIINQKCGLVTTVWGFIDGTLRQTCRPFYHQKVMYCGHKRAHGMKFQSEIAPDGIFACLFGAVNGNRHDSFMLNESQLMPRLRGMMPAGIIGDGGLDADPVDGVYSLYADPAYPQSAFIFGGFQNPPDGSRKAQWNSNMSSVRESVEWGFAYINQQWAFVNFRKALKIYKTPVAKYYVVATFLCNLRTMFYGNQTMSFFDCAGDSMSIDEYLQLID